MKKVVLIMVVLLSCGLLASRSVVYAEEEGESARITPERNHLLLDVNQRVELGDVVVEGTFGETNLANGQLTSAHPSVTIGDVFLSVDVAGVFPILFEYQTENITFYLVAKEVDDKEYVIYEEDFSGHSGVMIPNELTLRKSDGTPGGSAAIDNERLYLSPYSIVLFPEYLKAFSNYIIETDMRMDKAQSSTRWASVMFRYNQENYYQMAIRQDATAANGVEFAKRLDGSWNVPATGSYSEQLQQNKTYRLKIDVHETTVKEYIDGSLIIDYDSAYEFTHGRIGVQTDNTDTFFDNIRITLPESYVETERQQYTSVADVYQPVTGIVAPATTLVWFDHLDQLDDFRAEVRPNTAIFRINPELDIVDAEGAFMVSLEEVLLAVDGRVIPAFYLDDPKVGSTLANELKRFRIFDVFVVSKKADVILAARETHPLIRGVLMFELSDKNALNTEDLLDIRRQTNSAEAVAALLPGHLLDRDHVFYMQKRLMTVWAYTENEPANQYKVILSGVQGILTNDYESIYAIYEQFPDKTHVRRPLMIAHRGLHLGGLSAGPENTIESAKEAYARGADIIEIDVHFTLDLEIVVIHDTTTARTALDFDSIVIKSTRFEDLRKIYLSDPVGGRTDIVIPTLREFIEAFKGKDVVLFIELKPTEQLLVEFVADLIDEMDAYDQAVIITFSAQNIQNMKTYMPEMANGYLTLSVLNAQSVETSLMQMFSSVVPMNSTLNPSYGRLTRDFTEAIMHRGITVWPWTINEHELIVSTYNYGVGGITTNHLSYFEDTYNRLAFEKNHYEHVLGDEFPILKAHIETPKGVTYPYMPKVIVVDDGDTGVIFDDKGRMTSVEQAGTIYFYAMFHSSLPNGEDFVLTSDLVAIEILEESSPVLLIVALVLGGVAISSLNE